MAGYNISFVRAARKEMEALSSSTVRRIFRKIESLAIEPRPAGCAKLSGSKIFGVSGSETIA